MKKLITVALAFASLLPVASQASAKRVRPAAPASAETCAPDVRIPLPLPDSLTTNVDTWVRWAADELKTNTGK